MIQHRQPVDWKSVDGTFRVPACGSLVWIDPDVRPLQIRGASVVSRISPVSFTHPAGDEIFLFRGLQFVATKEDCPNFGDRRRNP